MQKHLQVLLFWTLVISSSAMAQTASTPLTVGGSVKPPVLVKQVDPHYPRPLFGRAKEGEVLVHLVVDENGIPTNLTVQKSSDKKLAAAAMKAVSQYRFKPATRDEVAVAVEMNVSVNFLLQ